VLSEKIDGEGLVGMKMAAGKVYISVMSRLLLERKVETWVLPMSPDQGRRGLDFLCDSLVGHCE
jgi:hypothetical protein